MADTKLEWTDRVWNPFRGCRRVSPGCENCYAEKIHTVLGESGFKTEERTKAGIRKLTCSDGESSN